MKPPITPPAVWDDPNGTPLKFPLVDENPDWFCPEAPVAVAVRVTTPLMPWFNCAPLRIESIRACL